MDKYNEIFAYLQEAVDNGTMTMEHAEELNDLAYNKYVVESEENITLEEVMEYVENYLTESGGARQKYIKVLANKQSNIKKEMDRVKNLMAVASSDNKVKEYKKKLDDLRKEYDKLADEASQYSARVGAEIGMYADFDDREKTKYNENKEGKMLHSEHNEIDNRRNLSNTIKNKKVMKGNHSHDLGSYNRYGTGGYTQNISSFDSSAKRKFNNRFTQQGPTPMEKKEARMKELRSTKESVDLLRLQVFEAAQAGDISLEDRDHLLSLLTVGV